VDQQVEFSASGEVAVIVEEPLQLVLGDVTISVSVDPFEG
jgi:hypothetical protein